MATAARHPVRAMLMSNANTSSSPPRPARRHGCSRRGSASRARTRRRNTTRSPWPKARAARRRQKAVDPSPLVATVADVDGVMLDVRHEELAVCAVEWDTV